LKCEVGPDDRRDDRWISAYEFAVLIVIGEGAHPAQHRRSDGDPAFCEILVDDLRAPGVSKDTANIGFTAGLVVVPDLRRFDREVAAADDLVDLIERSLGIPAVKLPQQRDSVSSAALIAEIRSRR
jgi:hypothetical protein